MRPRRPRTAVPALTLLLPLIAAACADASSSPAPTPQVAPASPAAERRPAPPPAKSPTTIVDLKRRLARQWSAAGALELGAALVEAGRIKDAASVARRLQADPPVDPSARLSLAALFRAVGKYERARDLADAVIDVARDAGDKDLLQRGHVELAHIYGAYGEPRRQIDHLEAARAAKPDESVLCAIAAIELKQRHLDRMKAALDACARMACDGEDYHRLRVHLALARGRHGEAHAALEAAGSKVWRSYDLSLLEARVAIDLKQSERAIEAAARAERLRPDHAEGYLLQAALLRDADRLEEAREVLRRGAKIARRIETVLDDLSRICLRLGDRACLREAAAGQLQLDPKDVALRLRVARLHLEAGDSAAASATLEAIDPQRRARVDVFQLRLEALLRDGRLRDALDVIDADAATPEARMAGLILLGRVAMRERRLDEAAQLYGRVLKDAPDHAEANRQLGLVHAARGQHDAALQRLRHAVLLEERGWDARLDLADYLVRRTDEAHGRELDVLITALREGLGEPEAGACSARQGRLQLLLARRMIQVLKVTRARDRVVAALRCDRRSFEQVVEIVDDLLAEGSFKAAGRLLDVIAEEEPERSDELLRRSQRLSDEEAVAAAGATGS